MKKFKVGQRWRYVAGEYDFVTEIKQIIGLVVQGTIVQANKFSTQYGYSIGKDGSDIFHLCNISKCTYLIGQDKTI